MTGADPLRIPIKMLFNAIDSQEWKVLEALLHPQTEFLVSGFIPFRGRDAVINFYRTLRSVRKGEHLIESIVVDGDQAICWGRFNGTKNDGSEVSLLFADIITYEDKKIKRRSEYYCELKVGG